MSVNEDLHEQVHGARDPFERTVAATMAIIAALLAIVSVLGQHFNAEELLREQESADQWAFSQAKDIRRYSAQIAQDTLAASNADPTLAKKYAQRRRTLRQGTARDTGAREGTSGRK